MVSRQVSAGCVASVPHAPAASETSARNVMTKDEIRTLINVLMQSKTDAERLVSDGTPPEMTAWDVVLASRHLSQISSRKDLSRIIKEAEEAGLLGVLTSLPGPWNAVSTMEEKVQLARSIQIADGQGANVYQIARWQMEHGDRGLGSNIAIPRLNVLGMGKDASFQIHGLVIIADENDAERISRMHVRKDGSFEPALFDSIISTTNDDKWREQRAHLAEAFLPLSSLAKVMPVSMARARHCADRLAGLAANTDGVDMSDFLLHEAMAQLQLGLLGVPEDVMDATNADIRKTFLGNTEEATPGALGKAMREVLASTALDESMALPTDNRAVRGPLTRAAMQTSGTLSPSAKYGNMLLVLFAGHDTTGHTMTWLLFELARHPEVQAELQAEIDVFFENVPAPSYKDLARLEFMDRCITETLRLWPAVANGTFRQLKFDEVIRGRGGADVRLPQGTLVNIVNWSRHRNPELWGDDVDVFNPRRHFKSEELAHVGSSLAAANPQSSRFSPFAHAPRHCLGRNFAQMEMRLIMLNLLRRFTFELAPPYDQLMDARTTATAEANEFRGVNRATMGPMDLEKTDHVIWGERHLYALKMHVKAR